MSDRDIDVKELARQVVDELEDTRQIGDQLLLSRREAIALSTGAVSLGALGVAGVGTASAQEAAGRVGTASQPVDVEGAQGNFSQGVSVDGPLEADSANVTGTTTTEALEAVTVDRGEGDLIDEGEVWASGVMSPIEEFADTTSSTFSTIGQLTGGIPIGPVIPDGAVLEARMSVRGRVTEDGETGTYGVIVNEQPSRNFEIIDELEVEITSTSLQENDSGWVEIISLNFDNLNRTAAVARGFRGKVTGGELRSGSREEFALQWRWVIR